MKCEQGDMAKIIHSVRPGNVGKIVYVESYIDRLKTGETFKYRGITCKAPITDAYWWITAETGLSNLFGDTPKAYIPDSWLEPLRPTKLKEKNEETAPADAI